MLADVSTLTSISITHSSIQQSTYKPLIHLSSYPSVRANIQVSQRKRLSPYPSTKVSAKKPYAACDAADGYSIITKARSGCGRCTEVISKSEFDSYNDGLGSA